MPSLAQRRGLALIRRENRIVQPHRLEHRAPFPHFTRGC